MLSVRKNFHNTNSINQTNPIQVRNYSGNLTGSPDKFKFLKHGLQGEYSTIQPMDSVSKNFYTRENLTQFTIDAATEINETQNTRLTTFSQNPDYNKKHLQNCLICIQCLKQNTEIIENKLNEAGGHTEILVNIMTLNLDSMEKGLKKLRNDYFISNSADQKLMEQIKIFIQSVEHSSSILSQNKSFGQDYTKLMISGVKDIFKKTACKAIELISGILGIENYGRISPVRKKKNKENLHQADRWSLTSEFSKMSRPSYPSTNGKFKASSNFKDHIEIRNPHKSPSELDDYESNYEKSRRIDVSGGLFRTDHSGFRGGKI